MPLSYKCTTPPVGEPLSVAEAKQHLRVDFDDDDSLIADNIAEARERVEHHCSIGILPQQYTFGIDRFPYGGYTDGAPSRSDYDQLGNLTWQGQIYHNRSSTILLPVGPLISVDSITYVDLNGVQQTLDPSVYQVDLLADQPRLLPAPGKYWPSTQFQENAVLIKFTVGFLTTAVETLTIPTTAPYVVTVKNSGNLFYSATSVQGATSTPTVTEGSYTFTSADAGKAVVITYQWCPVPALIKRALKLLVSDSYENREDVVVGEGQVQKLPRAAESCLKKFRLFAFGYTGGR